MFRKRTIAVLAGATVALVLVPWRAEADQVIADDLIVQGSICAGFDCVNGESFGFDTIRLKENNLRIRAFDTSNSASFPTIDWQITFNDSSNGGANKFAIDNIDGGRTPFTIRDGAPTNALFVDSAGRLGIKTGSPVVDLHVVSGNTPTLRLEQNATSGFTPQTWDVAGNETNFFIRDATNGSKLPFRIRPNAGTSSIDIQSGGIGINDTAVDSGIDVDIKDGPDAGGNVRIQIDANGEKWQIGTDALGKLVFARVGTGNVFIVDQSGNLTLTGDLTVLGAGGCTGC